MEQVIKEIFSPSKQYKVQIIKRKDIFLNRSLYAASNNPYEKSLSLSQR